MTGRALRLRERLRRLGGRDFLLPLLVSALVLLTALFAQSPLRDAATRTDAAGARLALSGAYLLIAPFCALLDMQALLTIPQHIAVLATLLTGFVVWRVVSLGRSSFLPSWRGELIRLILTVLVVPFLVLLVNVLVPRPMARLVVEDPDTVVVDVHAHTASSHDARPDWRPAKVREWHRRSGFNVAYITDHKRFGGAVDGLATNPRRAGDGVVLLSGLELYSGGQHVNVLSMTAGDSIFVDSADHLLRGTRLTDGRLPVIVQTIPFNFTMLAGPQHDSLSRTTAIEINDGAPKGLTVGVTRHAELLHLADSLNLALVAGSDNHGWGNTVSGWTLVGVPGWRALTPSQLAVQLETVMRRGRGATTVLERRTPLLVSPFTVAATVPVAVISVARGLTPPERASWLAWAWVTILVRLGVRRAAQRSLARAREARAHRRQRIRIVPIGAIASLSR